MAILTESFSVSIIIGIVLASLCLMTIYKTTTSSIAQVPGPWYSLWTGWVLNYHDLTGNRVYYIHALHERYGPVVRIGPSEVDITDLNAIRAIYDVKETFPRSRFYRDTVAPTNESMFSTTDIDFHRRHRKLFAGPLSETSLKLILPQVQTLSDLAIQRITEEMEEKGHADVLKWWLFYATDVVGQLTFGESFRMLESGKKNDYTNELQRVGQVALLRVVFPSIVRLAYKLPFKLPIFGDAVEAGNNVSRYASESLRRYRRLVENDPLNVPQTLFTNVFQGDEGQRLPFHELRDEAETFIIGGSDSTAYALTYITWAVCRDPSIREKLIAELRTLSHNYTEDQLRRLPYLDQIITETLRLWSITPAGLPRDVPAKGCELAGYWFDGGITVAAQAYTMHRDPAIFPQPNTFNPSRWANPSQTMKESYMPWGKGSRVCIGQYLALSEIRLAIAQFFLTFPNAKVSSLDGMSDRTMVPTIYFELSPSGGRCMIQAA